MNKPRLRSLQELKTLKRRLDEAARERRAQQAALAAREAAARRERELFATTVGPVTPLAPVARALLGRTPPEPVPLQRLRDEAAVLREALSDDFDVESLLDTDESLSWRRVGIGPDVVKKLRRGGWAIQAQLDLHGLRRDEARERLAGFLRDTARQGLRCVRIVHGKGNGSPGKQAVLKGKVHGWLVQKTEVLAFAQARAAEGGAGALVVLLGSPASASAG
ncbi:Smr/MutS family protein [Methylibium sp.]|uniref:Smr/MutS family protein n=1 Tax=Methylibium sp. TaxID=2067992 RepID=UPI00286CD322|nr:Smr/MutS family protein [Methylibium sp.]